MAHVSHFKELKIYKAAFEAAMVLHDIAKRWPRDETYALTDKARRSSRALCSDIAEAWAQRRYPEQFTRKLTDAEAELAATQNWLAFAHACGYVSPADYQRLWDRYGEVARSLAGMLLDARTWCDPVVTRESMGEQVVDPDEYPLPQTPARKGARFGTRKLKQ